MSLQYLQIYNLNYYYYSVHKAELTLFLMGFATYFFCRADLFVIFHEVKSLKQIIVVL